MKIPTTNAKVEYLAQASLEFFSSGSTEVTRKQMDDEFGIDATNEFLSTYNLYITATDIQGIVEHSTREHIERTYRKQRVYQIYALAIGEVVEHYIYARNFGEVEEIADLNTDWRKHVENENIEIHILDTDKAFLYLKKSDVKKLKKNAPAQVLKVRDYLDNQIVRHYPNIHPHYIGCNDYSAVNS